MASFIGISFPFRKGKTSFPEVATDAALIKQSLIQLILTGKGERVMRPEVGSQAFRYVFENNDDVLAELMRSEIAAVIGKFEPRVAIQNIDVAQDRNAGIVKTTIRYIIRQTAQQDTISMEIPKS